MAMAKSIQKLIGTKLTLDLLSKQIIFVKSFYNTIFKVIKATNRTKDECEEIGILRTAVKLKMSKLENSFAA
jgi:hypothetical protein